MIPAAFASLVTHLWQSTAFAAVAGLLTLALRRNQARVRYWLWLVASYKFLIPFSWLVSLGAMFQWRAAPAIMPSAISAVTDVVSGPVFLTALPAAKTAPDHLPTLLFTIWAIWACGFVVVAAGWAREWLRIRAMVRAASPLRLDMPTTQRLGCHSEERSDEESLFLSSPARGEILRPVKGDGTQTARCAQNDSKKQKALPVVSTAARLEPGVFGIFRPVLLLPEGIADRLTQAQLQGILAHELCHIRRRDNLTAAVHMLVEALFWFHPLVWWLDARLIDEREAACDEEVLQTGGQAEVYAESILKVCEFYLGSPLTCVSGVTGSDLKKRIRRIMREHLGTALSARKKFLLATAGVLALAVPVVAGVLTSPRLRVQSLTVAENRPTFDTASIKPNKSGEIRGMRRPESGGRFTATNLPLRPLIQTAYQLTPGETRLIVGVPEWADSERFDIEAKAEGNPTDAQIYLMLQSLLADRFKLVVHHETRQLPVYALVLSKAGKTGPRIHPHSEDAKCIASFPPPGSDSTLTPFCGDFRQDFLPSGGEHGTANGITMNRLAWWLSQEVDRTIVDRTGLTELFDVEDFRFTRQQAPLNTQPNPDAGASDPSTPPLIFTAVQEQLGLKLEPTTGPVDVLVIDHIEQPSPN